MLIFNELSENYTKVLYSRKNTSIEIPSNARKRGRELIFRTCLTVGAFLLFGDTVFAESLNEKAERLYFDKFIGIAKWVVIGKGGWDVVNKTLKEDFDGAKRCVIQYTMIFAVLLGLPWALNTIEEIFRSEL